MRPSRHLVPISALALALSVVLAPGAARADQVVIVRELRTAPGLPFGGVARVVWRVDGSRVREEASLAEERLAPPSPGPGEPTAPPRARGAASPDTLESTSIWNAEERVWRSWSKGQDVYDEMDEAALAKMSNGSDELVATMSEFFGTGEDVVQEVSVAVDSAGPESTVAGVPSRRVVLRANGRYYQLESNVGGSIVFVRTVWMARAIPGVSPNVPRLQNGPARSIAGALTGLQFLPLPMFRQALDRLDAEVANLPGERMRDELHVEASSDTSRTGGLAAGAVADVVPVYEENVLEVRTEPSQPELFVLPAGLHKREPPHPGEVHVEEVPQRSGRAR